MAIAVGTTALASVWALVAAGAPSGSLPPSVAERPTSLEYCYHDQLALAAGPFLLAVPAAGARPSRIDAGDACIQGDLARCDRIAIDPAETWIAGARAGDWICLTDGKDSGWVPVKDLVLQPAPTRARADWLGDWERDVDGASLTIRSAKDGRALAVAGHAEWLAGPGAEPHVGELDAEGTPSGAVLMLGDPRCVAPDRMEKFDALEACRDCHARLVLVSATLFVSDNRFCGGMNVNFDGTYHRRRK